MQSPPDTNSAGGDSRPRPHAAHALPESLGADASKQTDNEDIEPELLTAAQPVRRLGLQLPAEPWLAGDEGKYTDAATFDTEEAGVATTDIELNDSFQTPSENEIQPLSPIDSARRPSTCSSSAGSVGSSMHMARIPMPCELENVTFYQLVLHLFKTTRVIAFAIYREPSRKGDLPITLTCPDPSTAMRKSDHIFVFTR